MTALYIKSVTVYKTEVCAGRTLLGFIILFDDDKLLVKNEQDKTPSYKLLTKTAVELKSYLGIK